MSITENIPRRQYKRSFLKNIQSFYAFEPVNWTDELKQNVQALFQSDGYQIKSTGDTAMVQCNKNSIAVVVTGRGVVLSMEVRDYISFDHYLEIFLVVPKTLEILGCKIINNIVFQKTNSYKIGKANNSLDLSKENVFRILFSEKTRNFGQILSETEENYIYAVQPKYTETGAPTKIRGI